MTTTVVMLLGTRHNLANLDAFEIYLNDHIIQEVNTKKLLGIRGMFEMICLFLSGDFKFQVSPKVLISCPRSTPRG